MQIIFSDKTSCYTHDYYKSFSTIYQSTNLEKATITSIWFGGDNGADNIRTVNRMKMKVEIVSFRCFDILHAISGYASISHPLKLSVRRSPAVRLYLHDSHRRSWSTWSRMQNMFRLNVKLDKVLLGIFYSLIATEVGDKFHNNLKLCFELKMDIDRSRCIRHAINSNDVSDCVKFNGKEKINKYVVANNWYGLRNRLIFFVPLQWGVSLSPAIPMWIIIIIIAAGLRCDELSFHFRHTHTRKA